MAKPVILTVDDDPDVLRSIERDLRSRYASTYRILRASSGAEALSLLAQLNERGEDIALLLADQRMPIMEGTEFLSQSRALAPDSRRVLLTAYADTSAAIKAINDVKLHHYLLKPWDPAEANLYPVLDDLLSDWQATYHPPFRGLRMVGHRWSPDNHRIKDFLGRHQVPFRWIDGGTAAADPSLKQHLDAANTLPIVLFPDGSLLASPSNAALAERLGLRTKAEANFYDFVIVGGGPAGLAAAVYAASEGLKTLLIDRDAPGGQASLSSRIENYLGFPAGLSGSDLTRRAVAQALKFGVEILAPQEATGLALQGPYKTVRLSDGSDVSSSALLVATGLSWRRLNIPNLDRLTGAGVYYGAASTEALSCKDSHVYVVGGANSAGQAAMHFSQYADKVTMLVRGIGLAATMSQYLIDQIAATPNIEVLPHTEVAAVDGREQLEQITLLDKLNGQQRTLDASLLFIFIGAQPTTGWLQGQLCLDAQGFIRTGPSLRREGVLPARWPVSRDPFLLETSVPGIFAAGDTRSGSVKRVASGVGEGSVVVQFVHQYLATL
ncbi:MAG: FAD-dependent oxidoreductase [Bryobacter sp.]|nr:FAD-dependent oxidoreductase [Bryobacter sp.]